MSTFDQTGSIAPVEPLKMLNADGTPYERPAHVQTELGRILALSHSERAAEAPGVHSETLVYLIRHRKQADEELYEVVFQELSKRIVRTARRHVRGFPKIAIEEIVSKVEIQILELAATGMPNLPLGSTLGLTEGSVKWYLQQIFDKVGVRDRFLAAQKARQFGLMK